MAKRKMTAAKSSARLFRTDDFSAWNFIIFLTLSFILLVVVLNAIGKIPLDLRTRAGLSCPQYGAGGQIGLPKPEECPGGTWQYKRDANGCGAFFCNPAVTK